MNNSTQYSLTGLFLCVRSHSRLTVHEFRGDDATAGKQTLSFSSQRPTGNKSVMTSGKSWTESPTLLQATHKRLFAHICVHLKPFTSIIPHVLQVVIYLLYYNRGNTDYNVNLSVSTCVQTSVFGREWLCSSVPELNDWQFHVGVVVCRTAVWMTEHQGH